MSQPPYNPYQDDQQRPPPAGFNPNPPFAGYNPGGVPPPAMPPPAYGAYGQPPDQAPPTFPPPVHHTMGGYPNQPNMTPGMAPNHDQDYEANLIKPATLQFSDKSVRAGFIRKALSMGYMTAMISAYYDNLDSIFLAMGICAACSFTIILFACQTKYDFTSCMGVMFVLTMILLLFGIFAIFYTVIFKNPIVYVVYASLGALVFMVYLAIDTQMVMGGKRHDFSPEEYVFAAVQLFLDIIYIFIYLLQIIGYANKG